MARVNKKGRTSVEPFIRLHRGVTRSKAWQSLSCVSRCLLLEIWQRHDGKNNGTIPYSHREARTALGVGAKKIPIAFEQLQATGFLINRTPASFDWKAGAGRGRAAEWEITAESCDGEPPKALYRNWTPNLKTGTTVVTHRNHSGSRSRQSDPNSPPNRNHSGSRFGPFEGINGNYSSITYNLPCGGRIIGRVFFRTERNQPPLNQSESKLAQIGAAGVS